MIESFALRLATGIKLIVPEHPASIAVLKHALGILINTIMIICLCLLVSILIGTFPEMLVILVSFPILRMASGGIHLSTGMKCVVITTTAFSILSVCAFSYSLQFFFNIISLTLVLLFAPAGIEKQSRIKPENYPKLKYIATLIVISNFFLESNTLAVCFLFQALTLIPWKGVNKS